MLNGAAALVFTATEGSTQLTDQNDKALKRTRLNKSSSK